MVDPVTRLGAVDTTFLFGAHARIFHHRHVLMPLQNAPDRMHNISRCCMINDDLSLVEVQADKPHLSTSLRYLAAPQTLEQNGASAGTLWGASMNTGLRERVLRGAGVLLII